MNGKPLKPAKRDRERTHARLLAAATAEFAARGYSGARTARIARKAKVNIRMLYHYFGGKDALYVAVLEHVFEQLRRDELRLEVEDRPALDGLIELYAFIDTHFAAHPEMRKLFAFENLNLARHLRRSTRIARMSSPVLGLIERLLQRGRDEGWIAAPIDALHLYVAMVSLSYYSKAHAHTLSNIFGVDLLAESWQRDHGALVRQMLLGYLTRPFEMPAPLPPVARPPAIAVTR